MKRIAIIAVMLAAMMTANATSVLYFTRSQAERAVSYLNRQSELMIYCGYDYEIETYVLLNEVWAERVNSAFYELWIYGYDAYTGEEIYMPIDLQCIWLYSAGRMYNAAQYLRFRTDGRLRMPTITWTVPAYNHFTRVVHRPDYRRTYHYEVHRHGWMPPAPPAPGYHGPATHPYHVYYLRAPHTPAPRPASTWTPGAERPRIEHPAQAGSSSGARPTPTGSNSGHSAGAPATQHSGAATSAPTRSGSGTSAAPTRGTSTQGSNGKTTAPTRSNSSSAAPTRSGSAPSTAPTRGTSTQSSSNKSTTPTRSSNSSAAPTRSGSSSSAAPTRSTSTQSKDVKSTTPTRSNSSAAPTRSTSTQSSSSKSTAPTRSSAPTRSTSTQSDNSKSAAPTRSSAPTRR